MPKTRYAAGVVGVLMLLGSPQLMGQAPQAVASSPWAGAWQWLHDVQDGRLLLLESGWFCGVFGLKDRALPKGEQPTEAEAARLYRQMAGPACGTVTVVTDAAGNVVMETTNRITAKPGAVGSVARRSFDIVDDQMTSEVRSPDGVLRTTWTYRRLSQPGRSPLAGAWELVSDEREGFLLMTDTEYRYVIAQTNRPITSAPVGDLSDAEAAVLYRTYEAQGGSYAVSGTTMTRRPAVAKDPRNQGRDVVLPFSLDDRLLITGTSEQRLTWRKLD